MKKIITIGLCILLSGCGLSTEECKNIALREAHSWEQIGYNEGLSDGTEFGIADCQKHLEQFKPPEDCMILIIDDISMRYICKNLQGEEIYNMIRDNDFSHINKNVSRH